MLGSRFDDVLERARSGDPLAFGELWRDAQPRLLRYLQVMVGGRAEEIAEHAWAGAIEGLGGFTGNEPGFRRWLVTVARECSIEVVRREARRPSEPVDVGAGTRRSAVAPAPAGVLARPLSTQQALDLIGRLPRHQAELVLLRILLDLDVADVADVTGRTPGSVRVAVHRALRRLEGILTQDLMGGDAERRRVALPMMDSTPSPDHRADFGVADLFMAGRTDVLPDELDALFAAATAATSTAEVAGAQSAVEAFLAVGPGSPAVLEARALRAEAAGLRGRRRAVAVVAGTALLLAGVSAAYAGALPPSLQRVAHTVIAAPAPPTVVSGGIGTAPRPTAAEPGTGADAPPHTSPADGDRQAPAG